MLEISFVFVKKSNFILGFVSKARFKKLRLENDDTPNIIVQLVEDSQASLADLQPEWKSQIKQSNK